MKKGGKVLGKGGYGCVIQPAIMCKSTKSENKVSKIIRMDELNVIERKELNEEMKISKKFQKIDRHNDYFLGGIENCKIKSSKINKKDLKNCNFPIKKEIEIMNIVMTKGEPFPKIAKKLNTEDLLKTMKYLLIGAKKSLINLNITLLDIKIENLLFIKNSKYPNLINPVFIDFSPELVPQSKSNFIDFLDGMGISYYFVWPREIMLAAYKNDLRKMKKLPKEPKEGDSDKVWEKYEKIELHNIRLQNDIEDFKENIKKNNNYDMSKNNYKKDVRDYEKALNKDYKNLMGKAMVYQIGNCYKDLELKNPSADFINIMNKMIEQDYKKRLNIDEAIKEIEKKIGKKNNKDLLIDYKKYSKLNKMKKLFSKFFMKKKLKKISKKKKKIKNKN